MSNEILEKTILIENENKIRLEKVENLKKNNISAWPNTESLNLKISEIKNIPFNKYDQIYKAAGRVIGKREHGKSIFITIQDDTNTIQGYIKSDEEKDSFELIKNYIDNGDYILLNGPLFLTKTNEITIRVKEVKLLSKCLHPIPDEHVGFNDIEMRYRQRTVDLLVNKNVKDTFIKRSLIIKEIRKIFDENDYLEVETPMLHPIPGGAAARPFTTHHNALDTDLYLRIAPELYLKRLVVGGFERVYEINRNFRNEGVSIRHNPEFTMLEFYTANKDYFWAMDFTENLIRRVIEKINGKLVINFRENEIDFSKKFERISAYNAILKYTDIKEIDISREHIDSTLKKHDLFKENISYNEKVFLLFEEFAESKLINPTFLIDFPIEISPLSKRDFNNPEIASRFELFISGMEISNGFNELNDPFEQAERFKEQVEKKDAGDDEAMYFDQEYLTALEYGLPPTAGVGIGIDRLVMLATNSNSIKDVILFPSMRRKN